MSELRVPDYPLPRPFLRVMEEAPVTRDDVERVRRNLQQTIDGLQTELKRERELTQKLEKSGVVLQEILSAPNFRALSFKAQQQAAGAEAAGASGTRIDEPPVEYVTVTEIELTDTEVSKLENPAQEKKV